MIREASQESKAAQSLFEGVQFEEGPLAPAEESFEKSRRNGDAYGHGSDLSERPTGPPDDAARLVEPGSDTLFCFSQDGFVRPSPESFRKIQLQ